MERIQQLFQRFARDESGQGLVEYVLIIALVAVGLIIALTVFRNQIGNTFDNVNTQLNSAPSSPYSPGS
jgi:pilus assembly protein Flp/PilA